MVFQEFNRNMFEKSCYGDVDQMLKAVSKSKQLYLTAGNPHNQTVISRLASLMKIEKELRNEQSLCDHQARRERSRC